MCECFSAPFGEAAPRTGDDEPRCRDEVVLPEHKVRSQIARRPRVQEGRRIGTEFIEEVGELVSLDGVEERVGHVAGAYRRPGRQRAGWPECVKNERNVAKSSC